MLCAGFVLLFAPRAGFASQVGEPAPSEEVSAPAAASAVEEETGADASGAEKAIAADASIPEEATSAEKGDGVQDGEGVEEAPARMVTVHIVGASDVELQMFDREADAWRTVCRAPCDQQLPAEETYRIDGSGLRMSNAFRLDEVPGDRVVLQVDTASSAAHAIGVTAVVIGATPVTMAAVTAVGGAAVFGLAVIFVCPFVEALGGDFGECAGSFFGAGARAYGRAITYPVVLGVLGGGVALGLTGILLTTNNGSTDVVVRRPEAAFPPLERPEAFPLPRVTSHPVLTVTF